jgi:hypothetical protein
MLTILIWFLVSLVVTIILFSVKTSPQGAKVTGALSIFLSFFILALYSNSYLCTYYTKYEEMIERDILVRMLEEDYDSKNLEKALQFNADQKMAALYNSSPWTYCIMKCYSLDTIPIPSSKFIPKDSVNLNAVIKTISNKQTSYEK